MLIEIMPYLLGAAISPLLLATTVLLLAQPQKPLQKTVVYLLGALNSAALIGGAIFFLLHSRSEAMASRPTLSDALIHILLGVVLLVLAMKMWHKPPKPAKVNRQVHYSRDFLLGAGLMSLNFTSLIMFVPAGLELQYASGDIKVTGFLLLIAASTLAIWLPLLLVVALGKRGQRLLKVANTFMARHGQQVSASLIGAIALYVIYRGVSGL